MYARPDAVLRQVGLQAFRAIGFACAQMRRLDLGLQSGILFGSRRRRTLALGLIPALRYIQYSTHRRNRVGLSQLVYPAVFHRDSFAK